MWNSAGRALRTGDAYRIAAIWSFFLVGGVGCDGLETGAPSRVTDGSATTSVDADASEPDVSPPRSLGDVELEQVKRDGIEKVAADAGTDTGDVRRRTTRVAVSVGGQPSEGNEVFFHGADGEPIARGATERAGSIARRTVEGGSVTVALSDSRKIDRYATVHDVRSGGRLEIDLPRPKGESKGRLLVGFPGEVSAAERYVAESACGRESVSSADRAATISLRARCIGSDGTVGVLIRAVGDDETEAFAWRPNVDYRAGSDTFVEFESWSVETTARSVDVFNEGDFGAPFEVEWRALVDGGTVSLGRRGFDAVGAEFGRLFFALPPLGGAAPVVFSGFWVRGGISTPGLGRRIVHRPSSDSERVEVHPRELLPEIDIVAAIARNPVRPRITWQTGTDNVSADETVAVLRWRDDRGRRHRWYVVGPSSGQGEFQLPALPSSWDGPVPQRPRTLRAGVMLVDHPNRTSHEGSRNEDVVRPLRLRFHRDGTRTTRLGFFPNRAWE